MPVPYRMLKLITSLELTFIRNFRTDSFIGNMCICSYWNFHFFFKYFTLLTYHDFAFQWIRRTENNVLEVVEESLDVTLHGNQIRYKFTDSQVLEGLSVTETYHRIIILVPTVSSLHIFTYPHPDKLFAKKVSITFFFCLMI